MSVDAGLSRQRPPGGTIARWPQHTDPRRTIRPLRFGLSPLSRVRLDELLQEMLDRVGEVMTSRERLRALLDAVVGIGTDLDLRSTLQRIVEAACELAGARYGALGVIGPDRHAGRVHHPRHRPGDARRDRRPAARPRRARPAHRRPAPGADAGHHQAPAVVRLPAEPPADAQLPRRAGPHPRPGLRQPLPGREAGRRRVHRRRRGDRGRAGRRGRRRHRQRPAVRARPAPASAGSPPPPRSPTVLLGRGPPHRGAAADRPPRPRGRRRRPGRWSCSTTRRPAQLTVEVADGADGVRPRWSARSLPVGRDRASPTRSRRPSST